MLVQRDDERKEEGKSHSDGPRSCHWSYAQPKPTLSHLCRPMGRSFSKRQMQQPPFGTVAPKRHTHLPELGPVEARWILAGGGVL